MFNALASSVFPSGRNDRDISPPRKVELPDDGEDRGQNLRRRRENHDKTDEEEESLLPYPELVLLPPLE